MRITLVILFLDPEHVVIRDAFLVQLLSKQTDLVEAAEDDKHKGCLICLSLWVRESAASNDLVESIPCEGLKINVSKGRRLLANGGGNIKTM